MHDNDAVRHLVPHTAPHLVWVPYADDPLRALAQRIVAAHRQQLPDLTAVVVLLPELTAAARLRRELLNAARAHDCHALLGPTITTPHLWVAQNPSPDIPVVSGYARELLLTEALVRYPHLYGKARPWHLTDSLLRLFDELTLHQCDLPPDLETLCAPGTRLWSARRCAASLEPRSVTGAYALACVAQANARCAQHGCAQRLSAAIGSHRRAR